MIQASGPPLESFCVKNPHKKINTLNSVNLSKNKTYGPTPIKGEVIRGSLISATHFTICVEKKINKRDTHMRLFK